MSCLRNSREAPVLGCLLLAIAWGVQRPSELRGAEDGRRAKAAAVEQAEAAVLRTLEEPTDIDLRETTFLDALNALSKRHGLQLDFDQSALSDAGVSLDHEKVTLALRGVRLRSALSLMLEQYELVWTIRDGRLLITTSENENIHEFARVHDVSEVLYQPGYELADQDSLIDLLTSIVQPESWGEGNNSQIERLPGALVVRQNREVQEQIAGLLAAMRMAHVSPASIVRVLSPPEAIEAAIARSVNFDFKDVRLNALLEIIASTCNVPIFLDEKGMEDAGTKSDQTITYRCVERPLASALDEILEPLDLAWIEQDDVIYVSTSEKIENTSTIAVFGLSDLFQHLETLDHDTLIDAITTVIEPESWDAVGGAGSIERFPELLIVRQQPRILRKIEKLLDDMRKLPACPRPPESTTPRLKVYGVHRVSARELADLIPAWIEPTSWTTGGGDGTIAGLDALPAREPDDEKTPPPPERPVTNEGSESDGGSNHHALAQFGPTPPNLNANADGWLFVRQTPAIHKQFEKLLLEMGVLAGWQGGGFRSDYPRGDHPSFP